MLIPEPPPDAQSAGAVRLSQGAGPVTLIGLDCAAQHKRFGVARGRFEENGRCLVREVAADLVDVTPVLRRWVEETPPAEPVLLAFDAPLGWPADLGSTLAKHAAGELIEPGSDALFRRRTDDFTHAILGKRPLEVGADKIARVAVTALRLLHDLRTAERPFPLLWEPAEHADWPANSGVIEVYPAAALLCRGLEVRGYKAKGKKNAAVARSARMTLLDALSAEMEFPADPEPLLASEDAFDAAICIRTAADFVLGQVHRPPADAPAEVLRKEGWIWFGPPAGGA
ncbi:MAG: DUF429 domain-containing protein [Planctomycetota bacterium]